MTTIGGPGGVGGPGGAGGVGGPDAPTGADDATAIDGVDPLARDAPVDAAPAPEAATDIEALAADVAAGRLTPREAIDRLIEATAGPALGPTERAELRELLNDLVANDPHLTSLIGRI